jgi:hypothetical protein
MAVRSIDLLRHIDLSAITSDDCAPACGQLPSYLVRQIMLTERSRPALPLSNMQHKSFFGDMQLRMLLGAMGCGVLFPVVALLLMRVFRQTDSVSV